VKVGEQGTDGGYYDDDAYIAAPDPKPDKVNDAQLSPTQTRSYDVMLAQFRALQATLRCQPPLEKIQALRKNQPISCPSGSAKARQQWEAIIEDSAPNMVQVACMDSGSVANVLSLVKEELERQIDEEGGVRHDLGAWLWALLAKIPDLGTLDGEEVAELRELGKLAADAVGEVYTGEPGKDDEEAAEELGGDSEIMMGMGQCNRVILDMVITVVGEVYGQRDLLPSRIAWKWKQPHELEGWFTQKQAT
jgi:hypothetical protein